MKISELIAKLEKVKAEHGDLEVYRHGANGFTLATPEYTAEVKYRKILSKRESKQSVWHTFQGEEQKGEKVVGI